MNNKDNGQDEKIANTVVAVLLSVFTLVIFIYKLLPGGLKATELLGLALFVTAHLWCVGKMAKFYIVESKGTFINAIILLAGWLGGAILMWI